MTRPNLSRGLGRSLALATSIGMAAFVFLVGVGLFLHERRGGFRAEHVVDVVAKIASVFAVATPIAIWVALRLGRRLIRATTDRLDAVIATAAQIRLDNPGQRLPMSASDDDLDRLVTVLNASLERIERGIAFQTQFISDASHELRTPIAVIMTKLEIARRRERDRGHWEQVADEVLEQVGRMRDVTEKLLALARAGETTPHTALVDLRNVAASALERARDFSHQHGVRIEAVDGPAIEAHVDPDAISIALDNLVRNAVQHSPKGTCVRLVVEPGPRIAVEDEGPGVPVDQRDRIMQPFARGITTATDRAAGTGVGLGLAIASRIVAAHRGTIEIEDRPGGGARFVVVLPARME